MADFILYRLLYKHYSWHHLFCGAMGTAAVIFSPLYAQTVEFNINSYKTAFDLDEIGDWGDILTWEVWNGIDSWAPATVPPDRNNDVFIEKNKEVRLTQNEEVGSLYLFAAVDAGKKLNLQTYDLSVYGTLTAFNQTDGIYSLYNSTSLTEDWIYPETGIITFKGTTRTIVDRASWSGNNGQSRFGVIFNPDPDHTLTVNAVIKSSSFVVKSGTVYQTVNYNGTPATSSFSFNIQDKISPYAYGDFTIEPGATLISEGTKDSGEIIIRTTNRPATSFHLMEGGNLILKGEEPIIEAENIVLDGNVFYSGDNGTQQFITGTMAGVTPPVLYNHLFFEGTAEKELPEHLNLKGDFTYLGGGAIEGTSTSLNFIGDGDQKVVDFALSLSEAMVNKPSGTLYFNDDLTVVNQFTMAAGDVDFGNNQLLINGIYSYLSGHWSNLAQLSYKNLPPVLTSTNSTFPFIDGNFDGSRKIILLGSLSTSNTALNITYHQLPGINWDANFSDGDVPILHTLNSYFTFGLENHAPTDNLEIQISADKLTTMEDEDVRIVGDAAAAPGLHLTSTGNIARREITLDHLNNQSITLGSTGISSILPVIWLSYKAEGLETGNLISWSTAKEEANKEFIVSKSTNAKNFTAIGTVLGYGTSNMVQHYSFLDKNSSSLAKAYYQIIQVDISGRSESTPVFQLISSIREKEPMLFPNPYAAKGELTLIVPAKWKESPTQLHVYDMSGKALLQESGSFDEASQKLIGQIKHFTQGIYVISIASSGYNKRMKWIKTH